MAIAYHEAAAGLSSSVVVMFWAGLSVGIASLGLYVINVASTDADFSFAIALLGTWGMAPRLLRTSFQPLFYDEFDHLRLAQDIAATGRIVTTDHLFQLGAHFPGLELLTVSSAWIAHCGLWHAGLAWVILLHIFGVVGVATLVRERWHSPKRGAIAALLFAANPSWIIFHASFDYESLANVLFIWSLVFVGRWVDGRVGYRTVVPLLIIALALPIVHHATTVVLVGVLASWTSALWWLHRRDTSVAEGERSRPTRRLALATLIFAAVMVVRFAMVGRSLIIYWGPVINVGGILHSLVGLFTGGSHRAAFGGSSLPLWNVAIGYLALPVWATLLFLALRDSRRRAVTHSPFDIVMIVASALFFLSLPLDLISSISEEVHRSWVYLYLALAALVSGYAVSSLRTPSPGRRSLAVVVLMVLTIAGPTIGTSVAYLFPGPAHGGEDAYSIDAETGLVAAWMRQHSTTGQTVFADRFMSRQLATGTRADVTSAWQLWPLTYGETSPQLVQTVLARHVSWAIFDNRMTSMHPISGFWYSASQPLVERQELLPASQLQRYACLNFARVVFVTTHYEVVHFDLRRVATDAAQFSNGALPGCLRGQGVPS